MNNLYHLTQKVLTAAGGTPQPGDFRSKLLKKLLIAKGGTPTPADNEPSLWRKIATAVGATVDGMDGTWQCLFKITEGAKPDDSEWQLMNRLYRSGFKTFSVGPTAPTAPSDLALFTSNGTDDQSFIWTDNSDDETGFRLYGRDVTQGHSFTLQETMGPNAAALTGHLHNDGTPPAGFANLHDYEYYIEAYNGAGASQSAILAFQWNVA